MLTRDQCPICDTPAGKPVLRVPFDDKALQGYLQEIGFGLPADWFLGFDYSLHECVHCGLLYQRHALEASQSQVLYGASDACERLAEDHALPALAHLAEDAVLVRQLLGAGRPRVLDFGMGWGRFAMLAQAFGCEVHGVEMSAAAARHGQDHGIRLRDLSGLQPEEFDFILIDQVLEHLDAPVPLFQNLARSLKPGGLLLLGVPGHRSLPAKIRAGAGHPAPVSRLSHRDIDALSPMIHLNLFSNRSLRELACRAGLEVFSVPLGTTLGSGMLWNSLRQWNRTPLLAIKYRWAIGTRIWLRKRQGAFPG